MQIGALGDIHGAFETVHHIMRRHDDVPLWVCVGDVASNDGGKTVLNDVLAALKPRLHLFGHHHEFTDSVRQSVRSIGLDVVTKSYLLIDAETFKTERLDT